MHALDFGGIAIVTQILLENLFQDALLVIVIVDGEIRIVPLTFEGTQHGLHVEAALQQAKAHRVERAHPRKTHIAVEQFLDSPGHLAGSLVRKRHGEDAARFHPIPRNKVRNLVGDGTGLSRTCSRKDKHGAINLLGRCSLFRVEFPIQNFFVYDTRHQKLLTIKMLR